MRNELPQVVREQIKRGIAIAEGGGIVALPTDTVFGLVARMDSIQAVERIYRVKSRFRHRALPLLLADIAQIEEVTSSIPPVAQLLARHFFPGALTLVLPRSVAVPDIVTAGGDSVAVRVPAHPIPIALINGLGVPIVGTSANLSGQPSALTASEVRAQFGDTVDFIIDGNGCLGGKESTIIDVTMGLPVILREGAVAKEVIERICQSQNYKVRVL